ncbi:MAG TPA: hypothetical protein VIY08_15620, partial [Candidatus Nitrosocosmicus sp.]
MPDVNDDTTITFQLIVTNSKGVSSNPSSVAITVTLSSLSTLLSQNDNSISNSNFNSFNNGRFSNHNTSIANSNFNSFNNNGHNTY